MQSGNQLIPHLFRTEYSKITSVLVNRFGFEHIEVAEDIASDTFLLAAETWGMKGVPDIASAPRAGMVLIGDHPWEGRKMRVGDNVWVGMAVASLAGPAMTQ